MSRWKDPEKAMETRENRYQKTKADLEKALNKQNVEPDIPTDAFDE